MSYAHTVGETPNAEWIDTFTYQKLIDNEFEPIPPESIDDVVEPILSGRAITTESGETEVTALIQREGDLHHRLATMGTFQLPPETEGELILKRRLIETKQWIHFRVLVLPQVLL
ncbi:hypothetical protein [Salinibaculum marinum]